LPRLSWFGRACHRDRRGLEDEALEPGVVEKVFQVRDEPWRPRRRAPDV